MASPVRAPHAGRDHWDASGPGPAAWQARHKSTHVTETVYRHVIVPAIRGGATVMDRVFNAEGITGNASEHGRNAEIA